MQSDSEHTDDSSTFRSALAENVAFLLQSLDVIAVESLTSGNQRAAGFFFGIASLVRYFGRAEELGTEQDAATTRKSFESWLLG